MPDDVLERRGEAFRDALDQLDRRPPPVATLRRRVRRRRAAATVGVAAVVIGTVVVGPRLLEVPGRPTIDPVGSGDATEVDDGTSIPNAGAEAVPIDLDVPVDLRLLAVRFLGGQSLAIVDLLGREVTTYPADATGLSREPIDAARILADGAVVVVQIDTVRVLAGGATSEPLVHRPSELVRAPDFAPSIYVLPTEDETSLWVVQPGYSSLDLGDGQAIEGYAELVDLSSGEVMTSAPLPPGSFPTAVVGDTLLLAADLMPPDAGPDTTGAASTSSPDDESTRVPSVLAVGPDGARDVVTAGAAWAVSGRDLLVRRCADDDSATCSLELVDLDTSERRPLPEPPDGLSWSLVDLPAVPGHHTPWGAAAPDGRIVVAMSTPKQGGDRPTETRLVVIDPDTADVTTIHRLDSSHVAAAWTPDGEHLVLVDDADVTVLDPSDGTSHTSRGVIPADHYLVAIG